MFYRIIENLINERGGWCWVRLSEDFNMLVKDYRFIFSIVVVVIYVVFVEFVVFGYMLLSCCFYLVIN